ncbi:MAG: cohesin domain-containing protein, partial [Saprospiraceae bacterium]|nr:cohesin domain-containing protein [Saprospiraceae bacterium]
GTDDFTLDISEETTMSGENVCVDVTASNFDNILAMQFSIEYDETALTFDEIEGINLADLTPTSFGNPTPGVLTLSWFSNSDLTNGATVPDGTTIFQICFDAIGSEGVYPIEFSDSPTSIEIIDALTTTVIDPVNLVGGEVEIEAITGGTDDFTLDISEETTMSGENVCVDVTASNFDNILSMQFSMEYDDTALTFDAVEGINLADLTVASFGTSTSGVVTLSWFSNSDLTNGATVPDGTTIFQICFDAIGSNGVYPIEFSDTPTSIEIVDAISTTAIDPVNLISGSVEISDGMGGGGNMITLTASEHTVPQGDTVCVSISSSAFTELINLTFDIEYDEDIIQFDSVTNIQLVGLTPSDIVDDASGEISVSWSSAIPVDFSGGDLFEICFTALGSVGEISDMDFDNLDGTDTQGVTTVMSEDGYVQIDSNIDGFALIFSDACVAPGDNFCMDLMVNDFDEMNSMQFSIAYDSLLMELTGMTPVNLPGFSNSNINNPTPGIITLSWESPTPALGTDLANGVTVLELCFDAIGSGCVVTDVEIVNTPTLIEFLDVDFNFLALQQFGGSVDICELEALTIEVEETTIEEGASDCLEVTVDGFEGLGSMQWNLNYDPTVISNITLDNFGLDNLSAASFAVTPGTIALSWTALDLVNGSTVPDGTVIFEICYDAIGAVGDDTEVEFDTDAPIEIADPDFNILPECLLSLEDGEVEIIISCPDVFVTGISSGTCIDVSEGTIDITPTGGDDTFTFEWSNGELTEDLTGLDSGIYTVTVYSCDEGVSIIESFEVIGFEIPAIESEIIEPVDCFGEATGSIDLDLSFTDSIQWTGTGVIANPNDAFIDGLAAGSYTVTLFNSDGCSDSATYEITQPGAALDITGSTQPNTGGSVGSVDITVSGGTPDYDYQWSGSNGEVFDIEDIDGLLGGTYIVIVTDENQCSITDTFVVEVPMEVDIIDFTNICFDTEGFILAEITGGLAPFEISWYLDGELIVGQDDTDIVIIEPGNYEIVVTDDFGNEVSDNVIVQANDTPIVSNLELQNTSGLICDGSALVNPMGGAGFFNTDYTITWTNGDSGQLADSLCVGNHAVTITDPIGCFIIDTFTIECEPPLLLADMVEVEDASCFGETSGSVAVSLQGGMDIFFIELFDDLGNSIDMIINSDGTFEFSDLAAGDYTISIVDESPCMEQTLSIPFTIEEPEQLGVVVESVTPAACPLPNGSADVSVSGGTPIYQYYWEFGGNTMDPNNIAAGVYDLTIVDAMGCLEIFNDLIEIECFQIQNLTTIEPSCKDSETGSIEIDVDGPVSTSITYIVTDIDGNIIAESEDNIISGLPAGTYVVQVEDSNGNISSQQTVELVAQSQLEGSFEVISDYNGFANPCFDSELGIVELSGDLGFGNLSYMNCDGSLLGQALIENLTSGEQCFIVMDELGCADTIKPLITSPAEIVISDLIAEEELCFGSGDGMIQLEVEGGFGEFNFQWDDEMIQETNPAVGLVPGDYSVEITDESGCSVVRSVFLDGPAELSGSLVNVPSATSSAPCTGALAVEIDGGTSPYTYEWSNGDQQFVSNELCPGDYGVTITDAFGCEISLGDEIRNENDACLSFRNVISPNGDKYNEFFYIHCLEDYAENTLEIYNRWGHLVYSIANYSNTWNGKDQGGAIDLPEGGYFFVLKYREQVGAELSQMKGHVTIIRE